MNLHMLVPSFRPGSASPGGVLRQPLALALFLILVCMPFGAARAQGATCDIHVEAHTEERTRLNADGEEEEFTVYVPGSFHCRPVPDYFMDNLRARDRLIEEIGRREARLKVGSSYTINYEELTLEKFGYRCPDAHGDCPTTWIPSPQGQAGLSGGSSFAGSDHNLANTYVQRISGPGIGVQSIIDQGPIDAIDVWGDGAQDGGEVCFSGEGRLIYLDARTSPRAQSTLSSTFEHGRTCGQMPGPGSVVFLPPAED